MEHASTPKIEVGYSADFWLVEVSDIKSGCLIISRSHRAALLVVDTQQVGTRICIRTDKLQFDFDRKALIWRLYGFMYSFDAMVFDAYNLHA